MRNRAASDPAVRLDLENEADAPAHARLAKISGIIAGGDLTGNLLKVASAILAIAVAAGSAAGSRAERRAAAGSSSARRRRGLQCNHRGHRRRCRRGFGTRRAAELFSLCFGRGFRASLQPRLGFFQWRWRWRRRGRLLEPDIDQLLRNLSGMADVNLKPAQKRERKPCLNHDHRGERIKALPRRRDPFMRRVSGHVRARSSFSGNSSAAEPSMHGRSLGPQPHRRLHPKQYPRDRHQ